MKLAQFRRNISKELDRAVKGETVTIERGGLIFEVKCTSMYTNVHDNIGLRNDGKGGQFIPKPDIIKKPTTLPKRYQEVIADAAKLMQSGSRPDWSGPIFRNSKKGKI